MYRIAVCDDLTAEAEALRGMIEAYFRREGLDNEISVYGGAEGVMRAISSGARFDIYFLDILMPGVNGMELAAAIRETDESGAVIFVTSALDYAVKGYAVKALDYIVKPITEQALEASLKRVISRISQIGTIVIKIKDKTELKELYTDSITYVESSKHTLRFNLRDSQAFYVSGKLDDYAPMLTRFGFFLRCHKSIIVNLNYVRDMRDSCFYLEDGTAVTVSRSRLPSCKTRYYKFILDRMKGGPV